jgi:hypothetical protein
MIEEGTTEEDEHSRIVGDAPGDPLPFGSRVPWTVKKDLFPFRCRPPEGPVAALRRNRNGKRRIRRIEDTRFYEGKALFQEEKIPGKTTIHSALETDNLLNY